MTKYATSPKTISHVASPCVSRLERLGNHRKGNALTSDVRGSQGKGPFLARYRGQSGVVHGSPKHISINMGNRVQTSWTAKRHGAESGGVGESLPTEPKGKAMAYISEGGWNEDNENVSRVVDVINQIVTLRYEIENCNVGSYARTECGMGLNGYVPASLAEMLRIFASNLEAAAEKIEKDIK